jgi:hypothetical protein
MSDEKPQSTAAPDAPKPDDAPLELDRADYGSDAPRGPTCGYCKRAIDAEYFEVNGRATCAACRAGVEKLLVSPEGGAERFLTAFGLGVLASVAGTLVWYAVLAYLHIESGLVAIGVGLLVSVAVRRGARGRGGPAYQALGMALTYAAIAASYALMISRRVELPALDLAWAGLTAPLRGGASNLLGYVIIGIALWQPWKINRKPALRITGPYRLASALQK